MNDGKVCVSVCAETAEEFIENIKRAEEFADVIELRFDCLERSETEKVLNELNSLRAKFGKPFLITFRPKEQGGKRELDFIHDRIGFWFDCAEIRDADFVDIEFDLFCDTGHNWKLRELSRSKYVCSYHNFKQTHQKLDHLYERLADAKLEYTETKRKADVIKIASQTGDVTDSLAVWELLEIAKRENRQIIPIAMGEAGKWTRILGLAHGAFMTYASLDSGEETAPGQVSARDLIETYRAKELNGETEVYGIIGNPVSQSVSPFMHNAAFKFHHLNAVYIPFEVKNLDEFMRRMVRPESREIDLNFKGFSVTIPHKQTIIKHLDSLDESARAIGSVNTVKIVGGKLHGYNTDARGFIEPLRAAYGELKNAKVAILGAGGSARAAIYTLKNEGADVTIFARDLQKAKPLAVEFEAELNELRITNGELRMTNDELRFSDFDIVINTTPLGMKGKFETEAPVVVAAQMENVRLVYDLVYNPAETPLIKEARAANVPTIGGLAMLVAQGAEQFKIWTGRDAPAEEMNAAARGRL